MTKSEDLEKSRISFNFIQVLSLTTIVCLSLTGNIVLSWSAVLPKLEEDTSNFTVTKEDVSWLVSIVPIIGIFASFFTGSLMELLGPKRLVLLSIFPMAGFWLMMAFTPYLALLYVGRVGLAICCCCFTTAQQPLVAELSPPQKRGFISCSAEITAAMGMLTGYMLAYFLPWHLATAVSAIPCIPILLLLFVVPESPYWLVRRNRMKEAEETLRRLGGQGNDVTEQLEAMNSATSNNKASLSYQFSQVRKRENAQPVILLWLIFILREFGGKNAMFYYSVYMFREAQIDLDPFVCTILLGTIRLIGHVISALTTDRLGRKPLLVGSSLVCGLSVGVTGLFLQLQLPGKSWVCLGMTLVFVLSYGLGSGPIPWMYMGELIPTPVRPLGASFIVLTYNLGSFAMNYAFFRIIAQLGLGLSFLVFSLPNFFVLIITLLWLPETRGRSLEEIQEIFRKTQNTKL